MKINFKDIGKALINNGLPLLGGVLGGGAGEKVGGAIASVLGCEPTPEAIADAIQDPEKLLLLKKYQMEHAAELERIDLQTLQAELADVQSARQMHIEHMKATGKVDVFIYILASLLFIGFFALLVVLMRIPVPEGQSQIIYMLFGTLSTAFGSVIQYFFGSSKSSAEKTSLLAKRGGK